MGGESWHSLLESASEEQNTKIVLEKSGDKSMKFKPLHDRVLVEREESDEKSAGGIIIPDTAKEKPMQGKITPLDVKAGDTVLFGKWSGTEIKLDGTDYIIMKESDIMGIVG